MDADTHHDVMPVTSCVTRADPRHYKTEFERLTQCVTEDEGNPDGKLPLWAEQYFQKVGYAAPPPVESSKKPVPVDGKLWTYTLPAKPENKLIPVLGYRPQVAVTPVIKTFTAITVAGPYAAKPWPARLRLLIIRNTESEKELLKLFAKDVAYTTSALKGMQFVESNIKGLTGLPGIRMNDVITLEEQAVSLVNTEFGGQLREKSTHQGKFSNVDFQREVLKLANEANNLSKAHQSMQNLHELYPDERMPDGTPVNDGEWSRAAAATDFTNCLQEKYGKEYVRKFMQGAGQNEQNDPMLMLLYIVKQAEAMLK